MSKVLEPGKAAAPPPKPVSETCWSCRILSGSALVGAGYFVYLTPIRRMRRGVAPSPWMVLQLFFAASLASYGVVILVDPPLKPKE